MNKTSSNNMMERKFDILQQFPQLEPPAHLYGKVLSRIEVSKKLRGSKKWLLAAAATFATIVCIEFFMIVQSNNSNTNDIEILVQEENNQLYEQD